MADDPLAGVNPDPLAGYTPTPAPASTVGGWLSQAWDRGVTASGVKDLPDLARIAGNTFGVYDKMAADVGGFAPDASGRWVQGGNIQDLPAAQAASLAAERAKTAAASQRVGPVQSAIANAAGYAPLAVMAPEGVAGAVGTGMLGGALSAEGHDTSVPMGIAEGGATGLGAGIVGKALSPLVRYAGDAIGRGFNILSNPSAVTKATETAAKDAWDVPNSIKIDPNDVASAYRGSANNLAKNQQDQITPDFLAAVRKQSRINSQGGSTTAGDIAGFQKNINNAASNPTEGIWATQISNNLDDVLKNATPTSGHAPGVAAQSVSDARAATASAKNAADLEEMRTNLDDWKSSPANQAKTIAQTFYPNAGAQRSALQDIYDKSTSSGMGTQGVMHGIVDPAFGYFGATVGGGPGAMVAEGVGHVLKPTIGGWLGALQRSGVRRAIGDAYPALTGMRTSFSPEPYVGNMVRSLMGGRVAGGTP